MNNLIAQVVEMLKSDPKVMGVLLTGSRARGDATPGSDVDFWVLLSGVNERKFRSEVRQGYRVELHFRNLVQARDKLRSHPMELYSHLDGKILYDPEGKLAELQSEAEQLYQSYQMPEAERKALAYRLESARRKLQTALDEQAQLKMGYLASTLSWNILEGLWAANQKPMPPAGAVLAHLSKLEAPLPHFELMNALFSADPLTRSKTALTLIDWVLPRIN
ncbi:MAG: nucleotidyltransferase domain-containing protein [Meiothermus sp.]|uniref:nucleotidyltransferase domain-containing protein n=1 Tax=Meiothermus sp. TaxID=1955249 RepID=UPI0025F1A586|nr:nucleotidyltransferase domain-containing protein [Meiothermus sp.]MCS7067732.1 nucleotidyltransferase domain-containing protein [Meiothermus sp.]MDW8424507.1 nucleotidyltransferase domain-containing protein [Meiothermus sp.]